MFGISEHAPAVTAEPLFRIRTISRNCPVIEPNASSDHNNNYRSCWIMIIVGLCAQCVWWPTGKRDSLKITSVHQRWWAQKLFVSFALQIGHLWVCVWVMEVLEFTTAKVNKPENTCRSDNMARVVHLTDVYMDILMYFYV